MPKVQIKSEKFITWCGIFSIMEQFDALLSNVIDSTLGVRSRTIGYQYNEILRSLMCVCSSAEVLALKLPPHILL